MIEVAAGILTNERGCVLLMQRLPGKHLAGLWEFPGGKVEPGETVERALIRELKEELDIEVSESAPLISLPWRYPEKSVRLHALRVTAWRGEPRAREGHPLKWIAARDMDAAEMPAADAPIVTALRLPPYYAILENAQAGRFNAGEALRQLRMPGADRERVRRVARRALADDSGCREALLINHDIELARELRVGVHLKASQLRELRERPLPRDSWVGVSCHDAEELERAAELGADFATLSPVCATTSHPDAKPLGWKRFAEWVADARLPVYALGGLAPENLGRARAAGAQGVAGIRAFLK
ncbi:MAG TPA: Nudix family hydrolase [Rhodanobacteraceae bacterium]|nr:Nudix family hydrolase [Rhodanobacteraceae bacterium]